MTIDSVVSSRISGRIAYRDGRGHETGRERFDLIAHSGGNLLRAFCEMDDTGVLRDVTLALDHDWRPLDGFSRITKPGRTAAATRFGAAPGQVTVEGHVEGKGRISQRVPTADLLSFLGLHPLQGGALITPMRGDCYPGVFIAVEGITNSLSANGETKGLPVRIDVAFIGHEPVTVAAGQFTARRFALRWHPDWPPADLWVRQADCIFLLMRWSMIENWYELAEIEEYRTD